MKKSTLEKIEKILNNGQDRISDAQKNGGSDSEFLIAAEMMELLIFILKRLDEIEEKIK